MFNDLLEINRNKNGDYYFIFKVDDVKNHINPKAGSRNEVIIVGVPKDRLVDFLNGVVKNGLPKSISTN